MCEQLLDEGGILADVTVRELPLDWVPLEEDLLSLEMPWAFKASGASSWERAGAVFPRGAANHGLHSFGALCGRSSHCALPVTGHQQPVLHRGSLALLALMR